MRAADVMADPRIVGVGLSLIHFLWQGCLAAVILAAALAVLKRRSPRVRYGVAYATLLAVAALPVATYALHGQRDLPPAPTATFDTAATLPSTADADAAPPLPAATPAQAARERVIHPEKYTWERVAEDLQEWAYRAAPWACLLWLIGVACLSTSMIAGVAQMRRLKRSATRPLEEHLHRTLQRLAHRMGVSRVVRLLTSEWIEAPSVFGWLRPVILLPVSALTGFTPAQIQALLAHELAHLRRYDYIANWIQNVIETLLFYHPAVWWISRRVRVEREYCCDELAVAACGDPLLYARTLEALETMRPARPGLVLSARGGSLLSRIQRVLEPARPGHRNAFGGTAGLVSLAVMLGVALMLYAPFARAQQETRSLSFPEDRSIGLLLIRDEGGEYTATGEGEGWRTYAQAQGTVEAPEGVELMLRLTPAGRVDLSPLDWLDADALQRLDVSSCNLEDQDLEHLAGLTGLKALSLNKNKRLTVEGWKRLENLRSLIWLGIEQTSISDTPEHQLGGLADLRFLDAYESNFDDASAAGLEESNALKWLGLESTKISGAALSHFRNLTALEGLTLENTAIDDTGLSQLANLASLRLLVLKKTAVSDAGVASLAALPNLETLNLNGTKITEACFDTLLTFPSLRTVDCGETAIAPERLAAFKQAFEQRVAAMPDTAIAQASTNPGAPKVGLVISHFTATGPHDMIEPFGYATQANKAAVFLDEANFDLYAIVEPSTEDEGELPTVLRDAGLSQKVIDGTDAAALRQLDVIVSAWYMNVDDKMLTAMTSAIEHGVGYLNLGPLGLVTPGRENEKVQRLLGIEDPQYIWGMTGQCRKVSAHPILEGLDAESGFVPDMLNGYAAPHGIQNGTPILGPPEEDSKAPKDYYPLYVRTLGQGRIVNCQWWRFTLNQTPWGQYDLYVRCVNWAAKRPVEEQW